MLYPAELLGRICCEKLKITEVSLLRRMLSKWLSASLCSVAICTLPAGSVSLAERLEHMGVFYSISFPLSRKSAHFLGEAAYTVR